MRGRPAGLAALLATAALLAGCSSGGSGGKERTPSSTTTSPPLFLTGPGSAEQPIPIKTAAEVSEQWRVKVVSTVADAAGQLRERGGGAPPPAGKQYFLANVEVTFLGGGTASPQYSLTFSAEDGAGQLYTGGDGCGTLPEPLPASDVVTGTTSTGSVCWVVPADQAGSLVMIVEAGLLRSGRAHFALR